jgi:hypothetical protein
MKENFLRFALACALTAVSHISLAMAADVIQVDVTSILNTRSVTTLTNGSLVTWVNGVDGGGASDGYLTMAASLFKGDKNPHALPDSGTVPADSFHPYVVLNYNNTDGTNKQTHFVTGAGEFSFAVTQTKYSKMFLFLTSSEGTSSIQVTLTYTDATESKDFVVPDYYTDIAANDPNFCYLIKDLAKWNRQNVMTETNHHNIDALNVHPNPAKVLTGIKVQKTQAGYMVFWGATGVSATPTAARVPALSDNSIVGKLNGVRVVHRYGGSTSTVDLVNVPANVELSVFTAQGQRVLRRCSVKSGTFDWNTADAGPGAYILELRFGKVSRQIRAFVTE